MNVSQSIFYIHISHRDLVKNQLNAERISSDSTKNLNCNEYNMLFEAYKKMQKLLLLVKLLKFEEIIL